MNDGDVKFYRYCRFENIPAMLAQGWIVSETLPAPHGFYGVLLEWPNAGAPMRQHAINALLHSESEGPRR